MGFQDRINSLEEQMIGVASLGLPADQEVDAQEGIDVSKGGEDAAIGAMEAKVGEVFFYRYTFQIHRDTNLFQFLLR